MTTLGRDADVRRMVAAWEAKQAVLTDHRWGRRFVVIPAGCRTAEAITHPRGAKWDDGRWIAWT